MTQESFRMPEELDILRTKCCDGGRYGYGLSLHTLILNITHLHVTRRFTCVPSSNPRMSFSRFVMIIVCPSRFLTTLTWFLWAAFAASAYSPPFLAGRYSDTTSPIYPDRPIRPLPKRRLRARRSLELVDSVLSQPPQNASKPLFYLPFGESMAYSNGTTAVGGLEEADRSSGQTPQACNWDKMNGYQFKGNDLESDDEDGVGILRRYQEQRQGTPLALRNNNNGIVRMEIGKHPKPPITQSAPSSTDSVDGYDSFENTNNKKKRKIPTSGSIGNHHLTLSAEMAHMGISSARDTEALQAESDGGVGQYYGTGNSALPATPSGTGISGAGRGRYGRAGARSIGGRSPLGVSVNGSNALQVGRTSLQRRDYTPTGNLGSGKGNLQIWRSLLLQLIQKVRYGPSTKVRPRNNISRHSKCSYTTSNTI